MCVCVFQCMSIYVCVAAAVATVAVLSVLQLVRLGVRVSLCAWILKQHCVSWGGGDAFAGVTCMSCVCVCVAFFVCA